MFLKYYCITDCVRTAKHTNFQHKLTIKLNKILLNGIQKVSVRIYLTPFLTINELVELSSTPSNMDCVAPSIQIGFFDLDFSFLVHFHHFCGNWALLNHLLTEILPWNTYLRVNDVKLHWFMVLSVRIVDRTMNLDKKHLFDGCDTVWSHEKPVQERNLV